MKSMTHYNLRVIPTAFLHWNRHNIQRKQAKRKREEKEKCKNRTSLIQDALFEMETSTTFVKENVSKLIFQFIKTFLLLYNNHRWKQSLLDLQKNKY